MSEPNVSTWRDVALCREVDLAIFFPEKGDSARPAKVICGRCDVRAQCLADALALPPQADRFGVRGGTTPRERIALRQVRPLAPVVDLPAPSVPESPRRAA